MRLIVLIEQGSKPSDLEVVCFCLLRRLLGWEVAEVGLLRKRLVVKQRRMAGCETWFYLDMDYILGRI